MTPGVPPAPAPAPPAGPAGALGLPSLSEQPDNANARLASTPIRSQSDIDVLITTWASSHPTHSHEVTVFSQFGFVIATESRPPRVLIFLPYNHDLSDGASSMAGISAVHHSLRPQGARYGIYEHFCPHWSQAPAGD